MKAKTKQQEAIGQWSPKTIPMHLPLGIKQWDTLNPPRRERIKPRFLSISKLEGPKGIVSRIIRLTKVGANNPDTSMFLASWFCIAPIGVEPRWIPGGVKPKGLKSWHRAFL